MTFNADNMPTEDELKERLVAQIEHGYNKINDEIDELTSAQLKRVLKAITYVHQAGHLLYNKEVELSEEENGLIDRIYAFQEPILMLQHQLMSEGMDESVSDEGENNEQMD
jgi:transcription initiation factor IIE alpha subunit